MCTDSRPCPQLIAFSNNRQDQALKVLELCNLSLCSVQRLSITGLRADVSETWDRDISHNKRIIRLLLSKFVPWGIGVVMTKRGLMEWNVRAE